MLTYTQSIVFQSNQRTPAFKLFGLLLLSLVLLPLMSSVYGQGESGPTLFYSGAGGSHKTEAPAIPKLAKFDTGESKRQLRYTPPVKFVSEQDVVIIYTVSVSPRGSVDYVKSDRPTASEKEYWKGGLNALYGASFTPSAHNDEIEVTVTFPGVNSRGTTYASQD